MAIGPRTSTISCCARSRSHCFAWYQSRAAGILGINRGTLRKKLKQFGLGGS